MTLEWGNVTALSPDALALVVAVLDSEIDEAQARLDAALARVEAEA
jgi:hypothetical protein